MISKEKLYELRGKYPQGTRVILKKMEDSQSPPVGTEGRVIGVDDIGTVHVAWQNGSTLGLIEGVDKWEVVEDEKP